MKKKPRAGKTVELHLAAAVDDVGRLSEPLREGADANTPGREGWTPLHFAAQGGALRTGRLLLDHGASVDATNKHGNTPLWVAVFNSKGGGGVIQLLRAAGADPHRFNLAGNSPLALARKIANYEVAQFFADLPAELPIPIARARRAKK